MKAAHGLVVLTVALAALVACHEATPIVEPQVPSEAVAAGALLERMQGRWRSAADADAVIEIDGRRFVSIYGGETMGAGTIDFVDGCPNAPPGAGPLFVVREERRPDLCYALVKVDQAFLEYSYVERGNTLRYRRIDPHPRR